MSDANFASQAESGRFCAPMRAGDGLDMMRWTERKDGSSLLPYARTKLESADHLMEENGKAEANTVFPSSPSEQNSEKRTAPAAGQPSLGTRVFQNTAAQLVGRVISIAFSAVTSIRLARYLGIERMGEYGSIYAYVALFTFLSVFCLDQILVREISVRRAQGAEILRTGTLTALGFSLVGTLLAPLAAPLFGYSGPIRWLIVLAAIDLLAFSPVKMRGIIFQVEMRLWYSVVTGLLRQALWLAAVVLLALRNAAFYEVVVARTVVGLLEMAIVVWTVKRADLIEGRPRFIPSEARMMIREGFPLVVMTVAINIYHRIDQVMLHKMSGDRVLGPYVIAVQLTELFSALPVALMISMFPALAQSAKDEARFSGYVTESYRFLMVIVFAACALVTPVAAPLVTMFYGTQYLATAGLLVLLVWSEVPVFFGVVLSNALVAKGIQKFNAYGAIVGAATNVVLNLFLIPRYGAVGASWATLVSYTVAAPLFPLLFREARPIVWIGLKTALRPLLLTLFIELGLHFLPLAIPLKLPLAAAAFAVGGFLTGSFTKRDVERLALMMKLRRED